MFNKNDPLISAVQEVMKRNHAEREAAKVVNEKFGVYDRKALPHERQGEWDAAFKSVLNESDDMGPVKKKDNESVEYEHKTSGKRSKFTKHPGDNWKVVKEELKGNQPRIDVASSTGEKKPDGKLTKHDFEHLRSMKEENLEEREMTSSEKKKEEKLKAKLDPSGMKASMQKQYGEEKGKNVYFATIRKKAMKEDNEGFNNRHGLSVNASAEKQAVAVLNERAPNPNVVKKQQAAAANKRMTTRIKAREPREPTSFERFQAREKENPTPVIGGSPVVPIGGAASLARTAIRNAPGILSRVSNYLRNRNSQSQPQANLTAGAARRPPGQSVPQVTSTPGSATGRFSASGPFGSIRDVSKVTRRGGDARAAAGGPSGTMTSSARLQAIRRPSSGNTPPASTSASARPATSSSQLAQAVARSKALRPQKGIADVSRSMSVNQPPPATAAPRPGPSFEKTGRGNAPSVSNTGTKAQTDLKPANVMSAKPSFEFSDKQREAAKAGKASIKDVQSWAQSRGIKANPRSKEILRNYLNAAQNKTMKTDVKAGGTTATPTQTAAQSAEMKFKAGMAQRSGPSAPVKPTASPSPAPNVKPARNSTLAAPSSVAATTMATATKAAGQMAVDRMKAQNLAKSQTSSMFGGSVNKPKPFDQFQDKGKYAGDMRDTKGPAAAERLANPTFVPRPSPGTIRRNSTLAAPSAMAATAKPKPTTFGPK